MTLDLTREVSVLLKAFDSKLAGPFLPINAFRGAPRTHGHDEICCQAMLAAQFGYQLTSGSQPCDQCPAYDTHGDDNLGGDKYVH